MDEEKVRFLENEIARLERELGALRAEVTAARGRVSLTMRDHKTCTGCGGQKILHATRVPDWAGVRVALQISTWGVQRGPFEAYVCASCGHVELWVSDPMSVKTGKHIRLLEPLAVDSPYR